MENKATNENIKTFFYKCINFALSTLVAFGIVAQIELHFMVPFFPVLFFFDLFFSTITPFKSDFCFVSFSV